MDVDQIEALGAFYAIELAIDLGLLDIHLEKVIL